MPPPQPSAVRYHTRPPELGLAVGSVVRVTNLSPPQLTQLEQFIEQQLGGKRYN